MKGKNFLRIILSVCLWSGAGNTLALELNHGSPFLTSEPNKTISMDFKDAQLIDVLKIFSQQSGLNFIASSEIAGQTINLYLDKVPVEQALERILSAHQLMYELTPDSNIFVVKPLVQPTKNVITRVYRLKHATVTSSKLNSTLSSGSSSSSDSSESSSESSSGGSASGGSGIMGAIQATLSENGNLVEDSRTNSLIITDIPSQFPIIEQTLARLDVRIPQVLIEVEMLDISKNTADLLGAKWGSTPLTFSGAQQKALFPFSLDEAVDDTDATESAFFASQSGQEYTVGTISFAGLKFSLDFLRSQSDTRNLARPRILTLNNELAEINIKTDEAIGLLTTTDTTSTTGSSTDQAERVETGVFLKVTPQANVDMGDITMAVEPKVIQARSGAIFQGKSFKDPEERGTKSILRIKDGDTIVIGGLLRTDSEDKRTTVPVLGQIPILGTPFRHKDKNDTQRELIIFITPHIIKEDTQAQTMAANPAPLIREQSIPLKRAKEINKELSFYERHKL